MGIFFYALLLTFFLIPVSIRAYLNLKHGRFPLPLFQNNIVVARIKTRRALGVLAPTVFWVFHLLFVVGALAVDAWLAALAATVYMGTSYVLSAQIRKKGMGVVAEVAAPRDSSF